MPTFNLAFIKKRRTDLELSCGEVAEKLGMSISTYNRYENGHYKLNAEVLPMLAKVLKCKIKNFYT
jgi:transcriptional regulator with XRE-family HTH domain